MGKIASNSRRSFLIDGFLSVFGMLVLTQKMSTFASDDTRFSSEYIIDFSNLQCLKNLTNVGLHENQIVSEITNHLIESKLIALEWFETCAEIQRRYLNEGLLLSSNKQISFDAKQMRFLTLWRDKQSFLSFFKETEFYKLDYAYISAGLIPKMAQSSKVFPKSPEAYLLLQKS